MLEPSKSLNMQLLIMKAAYLEIMMILKLKYHDLYPVAES